MKIARKIIDKGLFKIGEVLHHPWWLGKIHLNVLYYLFGPATFPDWWVVKKMMGAAAYDHSQTPINFEKRWKKFFEETKIHIPDIKSIFELGGSWGSTAQMFYDLGFTGTYSIRDLPVMEKIQDFYLKDTDQPPVRHENLRSPDLFYAGYSLSELTLTQREPYLYLFKEAKYVLIHFQTTYFDIDNLAYMKQITDAIPEKKWIYYKAGPTNNGLIGYPRS